MKSLTARIHSEPQGASGQFPPAAARERGADPSAGATRNWTVERGGAAHVLRGEVGQHQTSTR